MANNIFEKDHKILYNSVPDQRLTYANQLTVKNWNDIINILKVQANMNAYYLETLHKWLIGTYDKNKPFEENIISIPENETFAEYVLKLIEEANVYIDNEIEKLNKLKADVTYELEQIDIQKADIIYVDEINKNISDQIKELTKIKANIDYVTSNFFDIRAGKTQFIQSSPTFDKPVKFSDTVTFEKALTIPVMATEPTHAASKLYVDTALKGLNPSVDLDYYYTKLAVDELLKDKVSTSTLNNYYNKTETGNLISNELNNYYNKTETDTKLKDYYTVNQVDEKFNTVNLSISNVSKTATNAFLIAKNAQVAYSFNDYQSLITYLNDTVNVDQTKFNIGQSFYIKTVKVPDVWISDSVNISTQAKQYTYIDDATFVKDLQNGVQVGYYYLSPLETQKVVLDDYATKDYVDTSIKNIDLSNYATKTFVTEAIKNIDYINYATKDYVDETINKKSFTGTTEQYNEAYKNGLIAEGCIVYITDDDDEIIDEPVIDNSTSAILGVGKLGYMILGGN